MAKKKKAKAVEQHQDSNELAISVESEVILQAAPNPSAALLNEFDLEIDDALTAEISSDLSVETMEVSSELREETQAVEEAPFSEEAPMGEEAPLAENAQMLVTDRTQIKQVLEAIIFSAPKAMSVIRLRNLLNHFHYDSAPMINILDEMIVETEDRGFQLVKVAGGYQFRSHPEHSEVLQKLLEDRPARLSASALEVLAIVAYKQPVSRSDIDSVRGVDSGHLMKGLLEKNLVRTMGHAETPGRPLLYGTTAYFLEIFTLGSLDDLAQIDEVKRELSAGEDSEGNATMSLESALGSDSFGDQSASPDSSGLASEPSRGPFDQPYVEETHDADFGVQERAREEINNEPTA